MPRSIEDIIAQQDALADTFERAEPSGKTLTREEVVARRKLRSASRDLSEAHKTLADAVATARNTNLSWSVIGEEIGTSGEAARQRFSRLTDAATQTE